MDELTADCVESGSGTDAIRTCGHWRSALTVHTNSDTWQIGKAAGDAVYPPAVAGGCVSTSGWDNHHGLGCDFWSYASSYACDRYPQFKGSTFNYPENNCCGCGGGTTLPADTSRQGIGFTLWSGTTASSSTGTRFVSPCNSDMLRMLLMEAPLLDGILLLYGILPCLPCLHRPTS